MEKIVISQFAGLDEVSLETGSVLVLIGPQATGKSVTAKLLYFFREIGSRLYSAVIDGRSVEEYRTECRKRFCRYFPPDNWGTKSFSIKYKINTHVLSVAYCITEGKSAEESLEVSLSAFYGTTLARFSERRQLLLAGAAEGDSEKRDALMKQLRQELNDALDQALGSWSKFQQIFIPAGRAFFSLVQASVFRTLESGQDLDPFLVSFGAFLEESKGVLFDKRERRVFKKPITQKTRPTWLKTWAKILRADFTREKKRDFFEYPDGRHVRLAQASSGQQEALPLLLALARFKILSHVSGRAIYIEEPEAHLFPATQREIVELMAETFRAREKEMCVVVTTHSPYILTALNNLLQAGQRYSKADDALAAKLGQIVPKSRSLNPGEVVAYTLENGGARSIITPETKLIDASIIDEVSTQIAVEFDRLLWDV
jgi:ABC-type cobalamin/Fe3+-siderophores transport system ATPase subunit